MVLEVAETAGRESCFGPGMVFVLDDKGTTGKRCVLSTDRYLITISHSLMTLVNPRLVIPIFCYKEEYIVLGIWTEFYAYLVYDEIIPKSRKPFHLFAWRNWLKSFFRITPLCVISANWSVWIAFGECFAGKCHRCERSWYIYWKLEDGLQVCGPEHTDYSWYLVSWHWIII